MEVKPYNIRTTVISPGAVATNMHSFYEQFAVPAGTLARAVVYAMSQPEDVDINEILFRPT